MWNRKQKTLDMQLGKLPDFFNKQGFKCHIKYSKRFSIYFHGDILTTTVISSLNTKQIPRFTSLLEAKLQLMCGDSYIIGICVMRTVASIFCRSGKNVLMHPISKYFLLLMLHRSLPDNGIL